MSRLLCVLFLVAVGVTRVLAEPVALPSGLRPRLALQIGHNLPVLSVAFSPDGKHLASGSRDNTVKLWDVASGAIRRTLNGHKSVVRSVAFSPNSQLLASAGSGAIRLWNVPDGTLRRTLPGHDSPIKSIAFSPDGQWLVSASIDHTLKLWNVNTGRVRCTLTGHSAAVESVAFSPDGRYLASGSMDRTVKLWDVTTGKLRRTLQEQQYSVTSVAFSPDGKLLAGGSANGDGAGIIQLWDAASGKVRRTLTGHRDLVLSVAFSPDSQQLASCSRDSTFKLWDVATGNALHTAEAQEGFSVAYSADGETVATSSGDRTVKLWDVSTGTLARVLSGHQNLVTSVEFSPDGKTLANGSWDRTVKMWDMETGAVRRVLSGDESQVESVKFSPDGKLLASSSWERTINLWDVSSGAIVHTLRGHKSWVTSVVFAPDGRLLATGSEDGTIKLWNSATRAIHRTLSIAKVKLELIAFAPDGKTLASTSSDKIIRLWNPAMGEVRRALRGHELSLTSIAFSPDGKTLASGSVDQTIKLWNVASGKVHTLRVTKGVATSIAFSPDSQTLASVGSNEVTLWDVANGTLRRVLRGHENLVLSVAFSPDGKRLASGSWDSTLKLWEPASGRLLATLLTLPEIADETAQARPISIGAKPLSIGAKAIDVSGEWFITTPEGWFDCSVNAARFIRWNVGNEFVPAERYYRRLRRPDMVQKSLRGEAVPAPDLNRGDIPPVAQFVRLQYDGHDGTSQPLKFITATLEVRGRRDFKEVVVLVNGRPLPPENEQPLQISDVQASLTARPLSIGAKPLEIGAKAIDIGAKPLEVGAKPLSSVSTATPFSYSLAKRYTFRIPLPVGAAEVRLRALAYDAADLGSNPAEIVLRSPDAKPVAGNLYILCAGIGQYKNGSDGAVSTVTGFSNLKFPDEDAQAIVDRLHKEGAPLYERVEVFNAGPLLNEAATLDNLRAGLKWLQQKGRPGQIDTIMVYLSGHGLSDAQGRYYFPTYEFDKQNWKDTSLSGRELQEALGGKVRARAVFLFVDTCHSGALAGARSDDLNFEVNTSGVYMMASSSATQYSYESDKWGHGAFTLALLNSLSRRELAQNGKIRFNVLTYAVPDEIARLMKEAGQNETAMAPVVPLEGRRLDEPVVQTRVEAQITQVAN